MPNGNPWRVDNPWEDRVGLRSPPSLPLLSRKRRTIGHVEPVVFQCDAHAQYTRKNSIRAVDHLIVPRPPSSIETEVR